MAAMPVPPAPAPVAEAAPLSEPARVLNTFFAPSKTFTDLRRSASWWLPFLITAVVSIFGRRWWRRFCSRPSSLASAPT